MAKSKGGKGSVKAGKSSLARPKGLGAGKGSAGKRPPPRIGCESVAVRAGELWKGSPDDIAAKGVTPDSIIAPFILSESLRKEEEAARLDYEKAFRHYGVIHTDRMAALQEGWGQFLELNDYLKPAAKHEPAIARKYAFVFEFMSNRPSGGGGGKGGDGKGGKETP